MAGEIREVTFAEGVSVTAGIASSLSTSLLTVPGADYTFTENDGVRTVFISTAGAQRTVTLPTASLNSNRIITIKKSDNDANSVVVDGTGSDAIDGDLTYELKFENDAITVQSNGSNWLIHSVREYERGVWTPADVSQLNITGTGSYVTPQYTRHGCCVTATINNITGFTLTTAGNRTYIIFTATGLPGVTNSTEYYGAARVRIAGTNKLGAAAIGQSGGGSPDVILSIDSTPLTSSQSLNISSVHFQYEIA